MLSGGGSEHGSLRNSNQSKFSANQGIARSVSKFLRVIGQRGGHDAREPNAWSSLALLLAYMNIDRTNLSGSAAKIGRKSAAGSRERIRAHAAAISRSAVSFERVSFMGSPWT